MFRIFISYNNENHDIVKTLGEDIAALSHHVWFDKELTGGQAWWDQILAEIRQCDVFVFALSPEALDSYPCKLEHEYACSLGKPILPIVVADGVSASLLPPALSKLQYVDYRRQDRQAAFAFVKALSNLPPPPPLPAILPDPPDVPISYLGELKDQIDHAAPLSFDTQTALVFKVKERLRQQADAKEGRQLLAQLRKRPDLFAIVAAEIDEALAGQEASSTELRPPAHVVRKEKSTVPTPAPQAQPAIDAQREADASARDINVDTGTEAVVEVLQRVLKRREPWTFMALPLTYVSVTSEGQTITAGAAFGDVARIFAGAGKKLKESGWQTSTMRTAAQLVTSLALPFPVGTLLLNRNLRGSSAMNASRSWQIRNAESEQLVPIAKEILNALRIIAPTHKVVTALREGG